MNERALQLSFFLDWFSAFLTAGKRNFIDCCIRKLTDGFSFLCLNLSWFFGFPIISMCIIDDVIGSLLEYSNQDLLWYWWSHWVPSFLPVFLGTLYYFLKNGTQNGLLFSAK